MFRFANASEVTDRLLVGGDLDLYDEDRATDQQAELLAHGVTHVYDCRIEWDDSLAWEGTPAAYRHVPIDDAGQRVPASWFEDVVGEIEQALTEPGARVLTHCHMGVNRGPSLGFAVLLAQGWDPVEALERIQTVRPVSYAYYAEDAVRWWAARQGLSGDETRRHLERVARHREAHRVDVAHVIADIRAGERLTESAHRDSRSEA